MSATVDTAPKRVIPLYWPVQANRNAGLVGLFVVVLLFIVVYGVLFPGLFTLSGFAKFTQSWFPLALVAMAQALLMLTGGISLAIGATVSLGAVIAATTMTGPLGVAGGCAAVALVGLVIGAAIGLIVVKLRLPAIVVTLAGSFIISGAAMLILPRPGGAVPDWLSNLLAWLTQPATIRSAHTVPAFRSMLRVSPRMRSAVCSRPARDSS